MGESGLFRLREFSFEGAVEFKFDMCFRPRRVFGRLSRGLVEVEVLGVGLLNPARLCHAAGVVRLVSPTVSNVRSALT